MDKSGVHKLLPLVKMQLELGKFHFLSKNTMRSSHLASSRSFLDLALFSTEVFAAPAVKTNKCTVSAEIIKITSEENFSKLKYKYLLTVY
jgi:hypothetical protein